MNIKTILFLLTIPLLLTACIEIGEISQATPTPAPPTATPLIVQATPTLLPPSATPENIPLPSATNTIPPETSRAAAEPAPALLQLAMFDAQNGWGLGDDETIYRTSDGGQTWQSVQIPGIETQTYLRVSYYDANSLYIVSSNPENPPGLLYITRDGGQTWSQTTLNNSAPGFASLIVLDPETLFLFEDLGSAAGSQGIRLSRSRDGGQTWQETFAHIPGETAGASLPFGGQKSLPAFLNADLGFIGGSRPVENDIYLFRTEDAGRTWQIQPLPVPQNISNYMALVQSPLTFRADGQTIIVPINFSLTESDPVLVFFSSSDAGQTWRASAPLAYGGAYHFLDPQTAWVTADGQLFNTQNGGQTWQSIPNDLPSGASINSLSFSDPQNGWALVFELDFQTHLYTTSDGGQTWQSLTP